MKRHYSVVGHRGFPQQYPENSLIGILAAAKLGVDAIELDVQISRDHIPIVIHDENLKRVCNKPGKVWDYSAAELEQISCHEAQRFGDKFSPCPLVRLDTLCRSLSGFKGKLFVEIKQESFKVVSRELFLDKVVEACAAIDSQVQDQIVIISFDLAVLKLAKQRAYTIGWVISAYNERHRREAVQLAPEVMISDLKKLPRNEALWAGDWQWFVYDVVDPLLAQSCFDRGIHYIESWDAEALMGLRPSDCPSD